MESWEKHLARALTAEKLRPSVGNFLREWRGAEHLPTWTSGAIDDLLARAEWEELTNRFFCAAVFGTAGIRGRVIGNRPAAGELNQEGKPIHAAVGSACINDINVARAAVALYRHCENWLLCHDDRFDVPKLVVAYDSRHFSRHFAEITAGIWEILGGCALLFDAPRSTPQLSFAVRHLRATAGVVITASHNPRWDNGFKAYFSDGAQVVEPHASAITDTYAHLSTEEVCVVLSRLRGATDGYKVLPVSLDETYLQRLRDSSVDPSVFCKSPIEVAYTPLHGTGYPIMGPLLERVGIRCFPEESQCRMDPEFSTVKLPNPENGEALTRVLELADGKRVDLALATDPDADRLAIAARDHGGCMRVLTGNETAILLTAYRLRAMKRVRWLHGKRVSHAAVIASYVTTPLLDELAKAAGVRMIRTLIGFKWIGEKLQDYEREAVAAYARETGMPVDYRAIDEVHRRELLLTHSTYLVLGAEESCGYMAIDCTRDKDSHSAALMVCEAFAWLRSRGQTIHDFLHEIYKRYGYHGDRLRNIHCEGADGMDRMNRCLKSLAEKPITSIGGREVTSCMDFSKDDIRDGDGKAIPRVPFWIFDLTGGSRVAIRASGTEPKMKCYLFHRAPKGNLKRAKTETDEVLEEIAAAIQAELDRRLVLGPSMR
ncbi:MAG: phospho-sugar mutase [Puniceicoccales bacterium]|jgi:phosphoglucomutase|nr:phospho-sugar mutase [Puniceicoccales bacterium]